MNFKSDNRFSVSRELLADVLSFRIGYEVAL